MSKATLTALVAVIVFFALTLPVAYASPQANLSEIRHEIGRLCSELESLKHVSLNEVIEKLNSVLETLNTCGNQCSQETLVEAKAKLNNIRALIEELKVEDEELGRLELIRNAATISAAVVLAALAYFLGPKTFSYLWFKARRKFRVKLASKKSGNKGARWWFLDSEVVAVIAAVVIVALAFSIAYTLRGDVAEPFSALGLLGPEGKIGNYPEKVHVGEPVKLHIFIQNYEGKPVYYRTLVKVGENTTLVNETTPANLEPIKTFDIILNHGENVTLPLTLVFNEPLGNAKLIIELWYYDAKKETFVYSGRWNHLYFKVVEEEESA